jgi:hypothetical protein
MLLMAQNPVITDNWQFEFAGGTQHIPSGKNP